MHLLKTGDDIKGNWEHVIKKRIIIGLKEFTKNKAEPKCVSLILKT